MLGQGGEGAVFQALNILKLHFRKEVNKHVRAPTCPAGDFTCFGLTSIPSFGAVTEPRLL